MSKLALRAIALLRKCDRKSDTFPAIWAFIAWRTGNQYFRLTDLIEADLGGVFAEQRDEILTVVCEALESGDLRPLDLTANLTVPASRAP